MIPVSSGWIAAHKETLLPETFIEIEYSATDPSLRDTAVVTGDENEAYFSDPSTIADGTTKETEKIATLEQGLWGLDGTFSYLPSSPADPGYVSGYISDANGEFETPPTITISFPTLQLAAIPGLTITWSTAYNEWATSFRVSAYRENTLIASETVEGNTALTVPIWVSMVNYNKITIEVLGWSLPYHRARCISVFLGIQTIYQKTDLMGFEHSQTVDLLSASLPKNQITFRLRNEDNRWNPDNPTGNEQFLLEQQELRVRYGMMVDGEIEWIKGGSFWLSEWSTPANGLEASFTARDLIEFMSEIYTGPQSGSLYNIAVAALEQANLPTQDNGDPRYVVDAVLENYSTDISGDNNAEYTVAQILQMVAHAGNCVFYQDRDGVVRIEPWNTSYSGYMIDQNVSYAHPEYDFNKPLKALSVSYGENQKATITVADRGEVQTIDNKMLLTQADALRVGERAREVLESRKTISGEFRADVRLDALDPIIVTSKYASNIIAVTDIQYSTTGGGFKGTYTGRVVSLALQTEKFYSGEIFVGEI